MLHSQAAVSALTVVWLGLLDGRYLSALTVLYWIVTLLCICLHTSLMLHMSRSRKSVSSHSMHEHVRLRLCSLGIALIYNIIVVIYMMFRIALWWQCCYRIFSQDLKVGHVCHFVYARVASTRHNKFVSGLIQYFVTDYKRKYSASVLSAQLATASWVFSPL
jgi:hypothetical protein